MYRVIVAFNDRLDGGYLYTVGAAYPREGMSATSNRVAELLGSDNLQHKPLIEEIKEAEIVPEGTKKKRGKRNEDN